MNTPQLEAVKEVLIGIISARNQLAIPDSDRQIDVVDQSQIELANYARAQAHNGTSLKIQDARAALGRMEQGTYGICVDCEEEIPLKRINAVPWASRCVVCQNALERNAAFSS
jgi:DnaK suppressor protein